MPHPDAAALARVRQRYEDELFEKVLPFWERFSFDQKNGGFFNCLDREGAVYDRTKHMWLQGRQVWMLSKLFRTVEERPRWLQLAKSGMNFMRANAARDDGRVYFSTNAEGKPVYLQRKIFTECFYAIALAEYGRASENNKLVREAERQLERIWRWAFDWTKVGRPSFEGETPSQMLAVPMILLNVIEEVCADDYGPYLTEVETCIRKLEQHVDTDRKLVLEQVAPDGSVLPGPAGRLLNPGHAIEAGWFVQHWAKRLDDQRLSTLGTDIVRWSHARGWDEQHGGLFYFLDSEGKSPVQLEWFMKLWWPHCEALYAHLLNYRLTGAPEDYHAFVETDRYAFSHFPDPEHGEWFGYLDREGRVTHTFKGGPYKGCFHVPRALWLCWTLLKELEAEGQTAPALPA
jgi:N-acylglucosamine 2-epimerase